MNAVVCAGYQFSTIISQTIARAADLVVIGAPGMHRNVDIFTGTTAERVIRFNDRPILMVKQVANGPYRRVLVAFDGSEGAVRSLHMGIRIAPKAEFGVHPRLEVTSCRLRRCGNGQTGDRRPCQTSQRPGR